MNWSLVKKDFMLLLKSPLTYIGVLSMVVILYITVWLYLTYPGRAGGRHLCQSAGTGARHFDPALCVGTGRR